ncbi:MAG: hypothetical protein IPL79_18490 [Myxococcales bacterium]|nr:hypothetical protein [Myxococcales bacterium]
MSWTTSTKCFSQARVAAAALLASAFAASGAQADDHLGTRVAPDDPPALFINLAPATGVGALSQASHAAIVAGAGVGLRLGEASGEAAVHLGTGAYARHTMPSCKGVTFRHRRHI